MLNHTCKPPGRYVHDWSVGDRVLWDDRRSLHARTAFSDDQPRSLRRIPVDDDVPVIAARSQSLKVTQ